MRDDRGMLRRRLRAAPLLAIGWLLAAAQAPSPGSEEILVEGKRLTPAEARERAIAYVHHTGIVAGKEAVARWVDKVCPRVVGLSAEHQRIVDAKFREVATAVGAPLGAAWCTPNVSINFVGDGRAFMKSVAAGDGRRIGEVPLGRRSELISGDAPIRWWYLTELRSRSGTRMVGMQPAFVSTDGQMAGESLPSNGDASTLGQYGSSLVSTLVNRTLVSATVVVDTNRASGATLESVASYAAFVALAEIQPRDEPLEGSILGLFGREAKFGGLSKLDQTFLRELYSLPLDRKARQQRTRLVRALQNEQSSF